MYARMILAAAALTVAAPGARAQSRGPANRGVAVVLSLPKDTAPAATLSFYQAALEALATGGSWQLARQDEVLRTLPRTRDDNKISALPVIPRRDFVQSHPAARVVDPDRLPKGAVNRVNRPLQYMLDTLALQGAIVVDCVTTKTRLARACGLFYYDRAAGRVVASARKRFRVGIVDPARWAPEMAATLAEGLKAAAAAKDKRTMDVLMARQADDEEEGHVVLGLAGYGETVAAPGAHLKTLPAGRLSFGRQTDSYALMLEGVYGKAQWEDGADRSALTVRQAGVSLTLLAKALDHVLWQLGLGAGYSDRRLDVAAGLPEGHLRQREGYVTFRPGLRWDIGDGYQLGPEASYTRYVGGMVATEGSLAGARLDATGVGVGVALLKAF